MEFGLFTEFESPAGMSLATAFDESLAQMKAAEEFGLDAVWLAEIHFQKDRSVLASPLVVAAALAACTRRIKIGIAVQVLPLGHPLRLAEDVATVDHLSKGRLQFGIGRSGLPGHYQGFNIPYSESRERFLETLRHPEKGLDAGPFLPRGQVFPVSRRLHHAEALPAASSADPHGGVDGGDIPPRRPHGPTSLRGPAHHLHLGSQALHRRLSRGPDGRGARRARRHRAQHAGVRGRDRPAGARRGPSQHDALLPRDQPGAPDIGESPGRRGAPPARSPTRTCCASRWSTAPPRRWPTACSPSGRISASPTSPGG